mmetsp:Transcript_2679/g.5536  ORF Transcript_2679/g.5536 Transcript_2679/m.5536 type:complete len:283 (+) Transcript_2679:204-1052(+)
MAERLHSSTADQNGHGPGEWIDLGEKKELKDTHTAQLISDASTAVPTSNGHRGSVSSAPEPPLDQSALLPPLKQTDCRSSDSLPTLEEEPQVPQSNVVWPEPVHEPEDNHEPDTESKCESDTTMNFPRFPQASTCGLVGKNFRGRLPSVLASVPENDVYKGSEVDKGREGRKEELFVVEVEDESDKAAMIVVSTRQDEKTEVFVTVTDSETQPHVQGDVATELFDNEYNKKATKRMKSKSKTTTKTVDPLRRPPRRGGVGAPSLQTALRGCRKSCAAALGKI